MKVGSDRKVPILLKNPFPKHIRLFKKAQVGLLHEAEAEVVLDGDKDMAAETDGPGEDVSPDDHPVPSVKLGPLPDELRIEVEEMLRQRYKAFSRGTHDMGFTSWVEHDIVLKEGQQEPIVEPQR